MKNYLIYGCVAALITLNAQAAFAGVPLKGVDVKLGKNPGGGVVAGKVNYPSVKGNKSATDDWSANTRNIDSHSSGIGGGKARSAKVKSHSNQSNN